MPIAINGSGTLTGLSVGGLENGIITPAELSTGAPSWDAQYNLTNVASINSGPLAGFRNAIINGNFDTWQRGTSFTATGYGADRWDSSRIGTTHTVTRQPFTVGQTAVPNEPTYFLRTVVSSVTGAGNLSVLIQRIEGVRAFAGQQVTVSFWAKVDATKNIAVEFQQYFGSGGSPSAVVNTIGTTKVSIGTTFQKVTVTATMPSITGKTLGTNNNDALEILIWFDAGSSFNSRTDTLGQQSGTFEIAQVQLEPGPVASAFERRPIGTELQLCERYYQLNRTCVGHALTATSIAAAGVSLNPSMRGVPTATILNGTGAVTDPGIAGRNLTSLTSGALTTSGGYLDGVISTSTSNKLHIIVAGRVAFEAEL